MRKAIIYFSFLLSPLSFLLSTSYAQNYHFRHLTTDEGLPVNKSWVVMKDSRGFIWIGTRGGLCRYDGYDVKVFQYDPLDSTSLSDNSIIGSAKLIAEDQEGYLWIGTQKGLNKFNPVSERFTRYFFGSERPDSTRNSYIGCVYTDPQGTLWVGKGNGLYHYQPARDHFIAYYPNKQDKLSFENYVTAIYEESREKIWVGTWEGLFLFDRKTEEFEPVSYIPVSQSFPEKLPIMAIIRDFDSTLLVGTRKGFLAYKEENHTLVPSYPFFDSQASISWLDIAVDSEEREKYLWITHGNLFRYNKRTGESTFVLPDPEDPGSILGQVIYSIYFDDSGLMWAAGTRGVNIMDQEMSSIEKYPEFAEQYGKDAAEFLKDSRNHLWIATAFSKLIHFDQEMKVVKAYDAVPVDAETGEPFFVVRVLFEDSRGNIWLGTTNKGLFCIENGDDELVRCYLKGFGPDFECFEIFDVYEDSCGTLWVCTNAGLFSRKVADPLTGFHWSELDSLMDPGAVCCIHEDRSGRFWIGTYNQGLFCRIAESGESERFIHYGHEPGNPHSLSNETVWAIVEDLRGELWFATENGLNRFNKEENIFERFISQTEKGANCIWDMLGDDRGCLWMTTEAGLIRCRPESSGEGGPWAVDIKKILPFREMYLKNIDKTSDGYMYVGGADYSGNGYFRFHPDSIRENTRIPPVCITEFNVRNRPFSLDTSIILKKHIILRHHQNFFSFWFTALDYANPQKNQYAYYLEGLEDSWVYSGNRRLANYTDVPPGHYIFRAKGSNNDGYWNEEGAAMHITILPPPWKTWWAYTLYGIFLVSLVIAWRAYELRRLRLKHALELKQVEAQKLKELDSMKSRFFANISHEFRTPLTLILGPLQKIFSAIKDEETKQELTIMQRNARRLQNLINQLLDLSKLESGKMELKAKEENIVEMVRSYVQQFESLAKQKGIGLLFSADREEVIALVDRDKIEKILYNLLGNAFKFTDTGGRIEVAIGIVSAPPQSPPYGGEDSHIVPPDMGGTTGGAGKEQCVIITISDTGTGIPPDKLPHIFDRFYQADDSYTKDGEGTGIGLALVKELAELHGGTITVESVVNVGSTFRVYLPLGKQVGNRKLAVSKENVEPFPLSIGDINVPTANCQLPTEISPQDAPLLLIVEDNADLRLYIRGILEMEYQVMEAGDGRQGLDKALENIPDLVLTDVMMPEMDGYELTRHLKNDERTSHIPIILLTARASMENKLEGLETGADDFITKPFDPQELVIRIRNLIEQRLRLQKHFLIKAGAVIPLQSNQKLSAEMVSMDDKFMQKVRCIAEDHIPDADFTIEAFSHEMHLSRVQLHRKLKALMGLSASDYIRKLRLNRAAELILNHTATITEIAYEVGFNNPSYFSECFKKQFGKLPSEYTG
jgi:signal transduction histidine kinase/ligand-binding sensor domain-containing protein/DNA-binding response OmpR family regulator